MLAVTVTGVPGATFVADSEAPWTETLGKLTGDVGGEFPDIDEPRRAVCGTKAKLSALAAVPDGVATVILPVAPAPTMAVI